MESDFQKKTYFFKDGYTLTAKIGDMISKGGVYATK